MLRHLNTEKYKDFIWHWFLVVGYEKEKHETWIDVATYGEKVRLNLNDLWKTGCEEKGGIVIYEIKSRKRIKMTKFHIFYTFLNYNYS